MDDKREQKESIRQRIDRLDGLFKEYTFRERMAMTLKGVTMRRDTRLYQFAKLQLQLLCGPLAAVLVTLTILIVLLLLPASERAEQASVVPVDLAEAETQALVEPEPPYEPPDSVPEFITLSDDLLSNGVQSDFMVVDGPSTPMVSNMPLSPKPSTISAVSLTRSPITMSGILGSTRSTGARGQAISAYGGDMQTEESVMRALRWLKIQQNEDGGWPGDFKATQKNKKSTPTVSGFVILAFLSHGETPGSSDEFGETVERGLKYLISLKTPGWMGAYALAEAYGMTMNPVLGDAAAKALSPVVARVSKAVSSDDLDGAFIAMALHTAELGGIDLPDLTRARANIEASYREKGARLAASSAKGTWTMTACAIGLQFLGFQNDPVIQSIVNKLMDIWPPPTLNQSSTSCCPVRANYFVTMMYFNIGGSIWDKWNRDMKNVYVKGQVVESGKYIDHRGKPQDVGFWYYDDTAGGKEHAGSQPLVSTCYIVQQLMVYYRYLPTYKSIADSSTQLKADIDDVEITIRF